MKSRFSPSALSAALLLSSAALFGCAAQAQVAAPAAEPVAVAGTRIGFVNTDRLFSETNAAQNAQNKLKQGFASREKQLLGMGESLQKAMNQFEKDAPRMSEAQRAERQRQLMTQDAEFQQKRREFQEDLNNRKNEELQQLLDRANRVVIQVAKAERYDVILQEAVYVDRRLDITDKVIAALNAGK